MELFSTIVGSKYALFLFMNNIDAKSIIAKLLTTV